MERRAAYNIMDIIFVSNTQLFTPRMHNLGSNGT